MTVSKRTVISAILVGYKVVGAAQRMIYVTSSRDTPHPIEIEDIFIAYRTDFVKLKML